MVKAPANRLNPIPKRSEGRRAKLKMKVKRKGTRTRTETESSKVVKIVRLTYALKLIFIPDFRRLTSTSLNKGKNWTVLSPRT